MAYIKISKTAQGKWLTKSIFFEECSPDNREHYCSFTLKDNEHEGYASLKQLYLAYDDPTEYSFAEGVFGSWAHWKVLCACEWFQPYVEAWREELEIRIRSNAIKQVAIHALGDKGFQAAKWLAEGNYSPKQAGRKSDKQKERESRINEGIQDEVEEDLARMKLIKGGK